MNTELLQASLRWRLLGLLFECPRPGWGEELRRLGDELERREPGERELADLALDAARATEGRYLAVLGPGGTVSPREVGYKPMGDPGRLLADLTGWYGAFSYRPRLAEPPDHVAIEVGFVAYLTLKEAFASARNEGAAGALTRKARSDFVDEHLGDLVRELVPRLQAQPLVYLRTAVRRLSVEIGMPSLETRSLPVLQGESRPPSN